MAKTKARRTAKRHHKAKPAPKEDTMLVIQGWMFIVAFALMLGIGAVVGTYFNKIINGDTPTVAGAHIELNR